MKPTVFDETTCSLGEGPLWHPLRKQLFWFDILQKKLYSKKEQESYQWSFDRHVSAAGWIDYDNLLIASETDLFQFNLETNTQTTLVPLEQDLPQNRSNDGRCDPWGGFWIGTMGKQAQKKSGSIYRYYQGKVEKIYEGITISNAICFSPNKDLAYFCDTSEGIIWRQRLSRSDGAPQGNPEPFLDLGKEGLNPDGAVCDAEGFLWNAQWGSACVSRYTPKGKLDRKIIFPTDHISCPAFGGEELKTLFITSAVEGLSKEKKKNQPHAGNTFIIHTEIKGQEEHQVIL